MSSPLGVGLRRRLEGGSCNGRPGAGGLLEGVDRVLGGGGIFCDFLEKKGL